MDRYLASMHPTPLQLAQVQALHEQAAPDLFSRPHAADLGLGAPAVSTSEVATHIAGHRVRIVSAPSDAHLSLLAARPSRQVRMKAS